MTGKTKREHCIAGDFLYGTRTRPDLYTAGLILWGTTANPRETSVLEYMSTAKSTGLHHCRRRWEHIRSELPWTVALVSAHMCSAARRRQSLPQLHCPSIRRSHTPPQHGVLPHHLLVLVATESSLPSGAPLAMSGDPQDIYHKSSSNSFPMWGGW
ncbi:hypothetical protein GW17_00037583 [Ensete ventricosum]|nr:hypothetical protein GW17_00037583 [Ensete ventricosum]